MLDICKIVQLFLGTVHIGFVSDPEVSYAAASRQHSQA